jgi:hypothetical protein
MVGKLQRVLLEKLVERLLKLSDIGASGSISSSGR